MRLGALATRGVRASRAQRQPRLRHRVDAAGARRPAGRFGRLDERGHGPVDAREVQRSLEARSHQGS